MSSVVQEAERERAVAELPSFRLELYGAIIAPQIAFTGCDLVVYRWLACLSVLVDEAGDGLLATVIPRWRGPHPRPR